MFELISNKLYRVLFILALVGTLIMTLSVTSGVPVATLVNDKVAHAVTFFVLAFLCFHALRDRYGILALIGLALFGLLIEVIQYFLPWRDFSWMDWLANNVGIVLYHIIHTLKQMYYSKKQTLD